MLVGRAVEPSVHLGNMNMMNIEIRFDGGCRGNPGQKYGSYEITTDGALMMKRSRFTLGYGTNNEAEFEALLTALNDLAGEPHDSPNVSVRLITDSMIVVNRLNGRNQRRKTEPEQRMFSLTEQCHRLLKGFGGFTVQWQGREENVAVFGH